MPRREKRTWILIVAMVLALACVFAWWLTQRDSRAEPSGNAHFVSAGMQEGRGFA